MPITVPSWPFRRAGPAPKASISLASHAFGEVRRSPQAFVLLASPRHVPLPVASLYHSGEGPQLSQLGKADEAEYGIVSTPAFGQSP